MKKKAILISIMTAAMLAGCTARPAAKEDSGAAKTQSQAEDKTSEENTDNTSEASASEDAGAEGMTAEEAQTEDAGAHAKADPDSIYLDLMARKDLNTNSEGQMIAYVRYPHIELAENDTAHDGLQNALDSYNRLVENNIGAVLNDITSYAEFDAQQGRDVAWAAAYSTTMDDYVMRSDNDIVSILEYTYYYSGGAHPMTSFGCANFDPATGKRLHIQDVVNDVDTLDEKLAAAIDEKYGKNLGGMLQDGELAVTIEKMISPMEANGGIDVITGQEVTSDDAQLPFTIDNNGITFWFSPYSIAPYAAGSQTVTFTFDEYPGLVKSEYIKTKDEYILPLVPGQEYSIETGSGSTEITYYIGLDENCDSVLSITADGMDYTYNDMGMASNPYLYLVKADGKSFLYYVFDAEDAYGAIACIDPAKITGKTDDMRYASAWPFSRALVDPGHLVLERRCDYLSTYFTQCLYAVGEDGLPVKLGKWDDIKDVNYDGIDTVLTLKCNLEATVVDENGKETGSKTLKQGDKLSFLRTDNESWVDMKDEAGDICRIRPVISTEGSGPWETVDGKDINDVFAGMVFAG